MCSFATAKIQLQSKLSDNVSYLSHYGTKFMAQRIKYVFSMMMNLECCLAAFEVLTMKKSVCYTEANAVFEKFSVRLCDGNRTCDGI